jgi:small-conductance mechanosensitive channel
LQNGDLAVLRQQKSELDALTAELEGLSPVIVALDKQKVLIAEYKSHLLAWRTAVAGQYRQAWKNLLIRVLIVVLIIGLLVGIGEVPRRLTLGRIQDPNRRQVIGLVHRFVMLFAIAVVLLLAVASDLRWLATYFGLLSAGVAVALQNVILASLGYLLLNGKRGIRIGDRVQVSGVTGDVISMGLLQFQVKEFDMQKQRSTGHVATFSNSLFVSPAIGLLKFNSVPETPSKTPANKDGMGLDFEGRESATTKTQGGT